MKAYVVGSSALYFWRHAIRGDLLISKRCKRPLSDCASSALELGRTQFPTALFGDGPVHLMVPRLEDRILRKIFKYSYHPLPLPKDAFCIIRDDLYVASPEYCMLQAACAFSKYQLMELCMELCGKYALVPEAERGFASRNYQLADLESISRFVDKMHGEHGACKLRAVLRNLKEGSRSPMETREFLLACLPKRFGGYGIPPAELNVTIEFNEEEKQQAKRSYLEIDMSWSKQKLEVEYDGHADHASRKDRARDAAKRNILIARGFTVFTITSEQICDADAFDSVVRDIARHIDYRLKDFPVNWKARRAELRKELFKSLNDYEIEKYF